MDHRSTSEQRLECVSYKLILTKKEENAKTGSWYLGWVDTPLPGNRVGVGQAGKGTWILNLELSLTSCVTSAGCLRIMFLHL